MKSPFPGMDPFLELHWPDMHHRLIQYACDSLQSKLPSELIARVEERVFFEKSPQLVKTFAPDAHVSVLQETAVAEAPRGSETASSDEPIIFEVPDGPVREGFIEIRDRNNGKVITILEFLSPANKLGGAGTRAYVEKQQTILQSDTTLVEIDLVRRGKHVLAVPAEEIPSIALRHYLTCISPGWVRTRRELYVMPLRQKLPELPVPLRQADQRIPLDLQALIKQAYTAGRYDVLDYTQELEPPLDNAEKAWVVELMKTRS